MSDWRGRSGRCVRAEHLASLNYEAKFQHSKNHNYQGKYVRLGIKAVIFATTIYLGGCASIVSGTKQSVSFNSEPDGALVTVSGKVVGKTPVSVDVPKGKNQAFTFAKDGFKTYSGQLSTSTDGWFWGNIVFGGFFGSTTDGVSGAIYEFAPDQYYVTLAPATPFEISSEKPRKIKELIVAFGDQLREELASQPGERCGALFAALGIAEADKETALIVLRKLLAESGNDLEFATKVISFYEVK
jgi:hypothetical protein